MDVRSSAEAEDVMTKNKVLPSGTWAHKCDKGGTTYNYSRWVKCIKCKAPHPDAIVCPKCEGVATARYEYGAGGCDRCGGEGIVLP